MNVQCELCPKGCVIAPGQSGECRIRINIDGKLAAVTYGHPCSVHVDPVEKKPMYHFLPGTGILSVATVGCNLHCKNCQNWEISQQNPEDVSAAFLPPENIPPLAVKHNCPSVAYTYSEPLAWYEYTLDGCIGARDAGLRNVLVTAGYANRPPLEKLFRYVDGMNIDIKAMSDEFYRDICGGTLQPVLNACMLAKSSGVWVELTNLVIPTLNDSDKDLQKLCRWAAAEMGEDTPLHFSRFFPHYKMKNLPQTPAETLDRAEQIARAEGLRHVYIGNLDRPKGNNTYCHACNRLLVERRGFVVVRNDIAGGKCPDCKTEVSGIWK